MTETQINPTKAKLEEANILKEPVSVEFIGSAGAGKSTFISGVHRVLGYGLRGMTTHKEAHEGWRRGKIITNSMHGINRSNATHRDFDKFSVYGVVPAGVVEVQLYAPGGHRKSRLPEEQSATSAYFLDGSLVQRAKLVNTSCDDFEFFPLKENRGAYFQIEERLSYGQMSSGFMDRVRTEYEKALKGCVIYCDPKKPKLRGIRYAICKAFGLEIFKEDELGITIETLLDSQLRLDEKTSAGIPVMGIATRDLSEGNSEPGLINPEEVLNGLVKRYNQYLKQKGYPYNSRESHSGENEIVTAVLATSRHTHSGHNRKVRKVDFSKIGTWYDVDSCQGDRTSVIRPIWDLARTALERKGYDTSKFRLIRFDKKHLNEETTVHIDNVL